MERVRAGLGKDHPFVVNGEERWGDGFYEERSPIDSDIVVGRYAQATEADVNDAVAAAKDYFPTWSTTPWRERVALMRRAADVMEARQFDLAAIVAIEVGKNRLEALGDVAETVEFFRYYAQQMEDHDGFVTPLGQLSPAEDNRSVLRPYGVWTIISPFNFPMALAGGPSIGALLTGNTVILKPSNAGALTGPRVCPGPARGRCPRRGLPRHHRIRFEGGDHPGQSPGRGRDHLHRLVRGRHGDLQGLRQGLPETDGGRDGRQEPGHRHGLGRSRRRRRRSDAGGVRLQRSEVLGQLPGVRRSAGSTTSSSTGWSSGPTPSRWATPSPGRSTWGRSSTARPWNDSTRPWPR